MDKRKLYMGDIKRLLTIYSQANDKICDENGTPDGVKQYGHDLILSFGDFIDEVYEDGK